MEGIELRDFAFEDVAQAPVHERTLELPVKKEVQQADKSAVRRFWSTHVRLTIEEAACRDHLGKKDCLPREIDSKPLETARSRIFNHHTLRLT